MVDNGEMNKNVMLSNDDKEKPVRGRKKIVLDLKAAEKLCAIYCTKDEIASFFNVSEDTLELRIKEAGYDHFTAFFKKHSASGKISLRRSMMQSAKNGNVTMQIWLSKQYLGHKDRPEDEPLNMSLNFFVDEKEKEILTIQKNDNECQLI